jgi:2-dehydropantoate 2-reductase
MVGAGAVGGYFGGRLVEAGRDLTFLVRSGRAAALAADGLVIRDADGETIVRPRTITADTIDGYYDAVLLSVKAYALEQAIADIGPAVGPETAIVPFLNGMRHLDLLHNAYGPRNVAGGVCLVASKLDADGAVRLIAPGASLRYGELDGSSTDRIAALDAELSGAGFDARTSTTIELDMWEKWVLLAAGGALNTLLRGTVGEIVAAPGGSDVASGIVAETIAVAAASGFEPRPEAAARVQKTLTAADSGFTTSMFRDLLEGNDVEAEQIVGDLVRRADRFGVPVPLLRLANTGLVVYRERLGVV